MRHLSAVFRRLRYVLMAERELTDQELQRLLNEHHKNLLKNKLENDRTAEERVRKKATQCGVSLF